MSLRLTYACVMNLFLLKGGNITKIPAIIELDPIASLWVITPRPKTASYYWRIE